MLNNKVYFYSLSGIISLVLYCCNPITKPNGERPTNPFSIAKKGLWISTDSIESCLLVTEDSTTLYEWENEGHLFWSTQFSLNDSLSKYVKISPSLPKPSLSKDVLLNKENLELFYDKREECLKFIVDKDTSGYKFLFKESKGLVSSSTNWQKHLETSIWEETSKNDSSYYLIFSKNTQIQIDSNRIAPFSYSEKGFFIVKKQLKHTEIQNASNDKISLRYYRIDNILFIEILDHINDSNSLYLVENIQEDQIKLRHLGKKGKKIYWNRVNKPSEF